MADCYTATIPSESDLGEPVGRQVFVRSNEECKLDRLRVYGHSGTLLCEVDAVREHGTPTYRNPHVQFARDDEEKS